MHELTICLSTSEKEELQSMMATAHPVLVKEAIRIYGKPNTRFLRENYQDVSGEPRYHLDLLMANESKILAGYFGTVSKMVGEFYRGYRKSGTTLWDYIQEASMAIIFKAIYNYTEEAEFTTFVFYVVRNHLIDLVDKENRETHGRTKNFYSESKTFEEMIGQLGFCDLSFQDIYEDLHYAIKSTSLTVLERDLLNSFFAANGEKGWQVEYARTHKSPHTGCPYSRQRIGQYFCKACEKLKKLAA